MLALAAEMLSSSTAIPRTQNTAPILEFRCLYTSDIRRKQKRWQDGRLKFHTFNKRIMVYDERSNFVADSHWREEHAFEEGEELEMDRCGILVQVCEFVGTKEQDLTALLNRAMSDKRPTHAVGLTPVPLRPFGLDIRTQEANPQRSEGGVMSAKRRKGNSFSSSSNGYAQSLTGAALSLSGARSNVSSARNDPSSVSSPRTLVKVHDNSRGDGRPVVSNMAKANVNNQAKMVPKMPSQAHHESGYSEKIRGAVLVLTSRTPTNYRMPPVPGIAEKAAPPFNRNNLTPTTSEDDKFIDIDIYDKKGTSLETTLGSSSEHKRLSKSERDKLFPSFLTKEPQSVDNQPERPANPLRIKTRPKKKLLSTAAHLSRPSSITMTCLGSELSRVSTADISYRLDLPTVTVPKVTQIAEAGPCENQVSCLSSPITLGIDYHSIDKILTRKDSMDTRIATKQHGNMLARSKNTHPIQSAVETAGVTKLGGQKRDLAGHIQHLQPEGNHEDLERERQSMVSIGITESKVEQGHTIHLIPPGSSPRSIQPGDGTVPTVAEDIEAIRPACHSSKNLAATQDMIPFRSPANLNSFKSQNTTKARKEGKQNRNSKNGSNLVINTESAVSVSKVNLAHTDAVTNNDQGPWTREAFDLFDWRPNAGTVGDSLMVG